MPHLSQVERSQATPFLQARWLERCLFFNPFLLYTVGEGRVITCQVISELLDAEAYKEL